MCQLHSNEWDELQQHYGGGTGGVGGDGSCLSYRWWRGWRVPVVVEVLVAVTCDRWWGGWFLVVTPLLYNGYYLL